MTVVQLPDNYSFASMMKDIIIDSDASINFVAKYKGKSILDESYCPDGARRITIRGLGRLCRMALWGLWHSGADTYQSDMYGVFEFYVDGSLIASITVVYASMATKKSAPTLFTSGGFLSRVSHKATRSGVSEWLTAVIPSGVAVMATPYHGTTVGTAVTIRAASTSAAVVTFDVSLSKLFPSTAVDRYIISCGESFSFVVDTSSIYDYRVLRYKNLFDAPESLIMRGLVTMEGATTAETAEIEGETRRVSITPKDTLTLDSGAFFFSSDYQLFHDLANALQTSLLCSGSWIAVVLSKYTLKYNNRKAVEDVSFTVSAANPENETILMQ